MVGSSRPFGAWGGGRLGLPKYARTHREMVMRPRGLSRSGLPAKDSASSRVQHGVCRVTLEVLDGESKASHAKTTVLREVVMASGAELYSRVFATQGRKVWKRAPSQVLPAASLGTLALSRAGGTGPSEAGRRWCGKKKARCHISYPLC